MDGRRERGGRQTYLLLSTGPATSSPLAHLIFLNSTNKKNNKTRGFITAAHVSSRQTRGDAARCPHKCQHAGAGADKEADRGSPVPSTLAPPSLRERAIKNDEGRELNETLLVAGAAVPPFVGAVHSQQMLWISMAAPVCCEPARWAWGRENSPEKRFCTILEKEKQLCCLAQGLINGAAHTEQLGFTRARAPHC